MAPKRGARAKQRARAAIVAASNKRVETKRAALRKLNGLEEQFLPAVEALDYKSLDQAAFERVLRLLNRRCVADPERSCFQEAVRKWVANNGQLPGGLQLVTQVGGGVSLEDINGNPENEGNGPSLVPGHRVLKASFRLQSKAVAWIRRREAKARTSTPWKETEEEFGVRLRSIVQDINDHCNVESLC